MYCFCNEKKDNKIGVFLKHPDYLYSNLKELKVAANVQNLELVFLQKVIELLITHHYKQLDPIVGDRKCQTRVSMLLDIFQEHNFTKSYCDVVQSHLNEAKEHLQNFVNKLDTKNVAELKSIIKGFYGKQLSEIFKHNQLSYEISNDILVISLCFFLFFQYDKIVIFSDTLLSNSKAKDLLLLAKKKLLEISIHYEQSLADKYGNNEDKKILNFVETFGFCKMTAFFPSFKVILTKIQKQKQLILVKKIVFCLCGGIRDIVNDLYRANDDKLVKVSLRTKEEVVAIIEGYQFQGSLMTLKNIINLPIDLRYLDVHSFKICTCKKFLEFTKIENIEDIILASFAQHTQFTNDTDIPWAKLGLENSDLKKEYDRLQKIPGCSLDDMSVFRIIHIYASTVGQELEDTRQLLLKLGKK